jgi:phosphatidylserine/phosphatidylglycerophosphate/cardiolipin synthase-like enzyme
MRLLVVVLSVIVCACGTNQAAPAPTPAPASASAPAGQRCEGELLELAESVPTGSTLDEAGRARIHRVWRDMIDRATNRIELSQFYVSNAPDSRLEPVLAAIERAADRGVTIRLLADAKFANTYPDSLARLQRRVELRRYDMGALTGGVQHAKYFIVDACESFVGSANFDWRSLEHIHELGIRIRSGAMAKALGEVFALDWELASGGSPATDTSRILDIFPIHINGGAVSPAFSPRGWLPDERSWDLPRLVEMIDGAHKTIRVQLLGYHAGHRDGRPFDALDAALRRAAKRGVKVELAVSHWDTRKERIAGLKSLMADGVAVKIVTIPEHDSGFIPFARVIHAKYMTVDRRSSWIGTSNWSGDYFEASRNVGVLIEGESINAQLRAIFDPLYNGPYAAVVDPNADYPPPRIGQ